MALNPPVPPEWLLDVFRVRANIGDPPRASFSFVNAIPDGGESGLQYTTGNGDYFYFEGGEAIKLSPRFSDMWIRDHVARFGVLQASVKLINELIAGLNPSEYVTNINAGGQGMGFPSFADVLSYYNTLKTNLAEEEARLSHSDSALFLRTKKRYVGGVIE